MATALWIGVTTDPDYKATTHVTLLPPTVRRDPQAGISQSVNPWTVETLMAAVITRLNSKSLHDSLEKEGLSGTWEVGVDIEFRELINVEVTARTESQARATTARLQQIATNEVRDQQQRYNLRAGEDITTIPFDSGENVQPSRKRLIRALIVVVGVGGILTVAFVIAYDAYARWRSRRRTSTGRARPAQLLVRPRAGELNDPAPAAPISMPLTVRTVSHTSSKSAKGSNGSGSGGGSNNDDTTVIPTARDGRYDMSRVPEQAAPAQTVEASTSSDAHPAQEDATIVLPLSNALWKSKADNSGAENGKR